MNPDLDRLQPYPFEKIRSLLDGVNPITNRAIALSIGEPKPPAPTFVLDALVDGLRGVEQYPATRGSDALRESMASWLHQRFHLGAVDELAARHILPVNGTREGLFAIAQCLLDRTNAARHVLMPNPFYQIYEGAALLAGCDPDFYDAGEDADHAIDSIKESQWRQSQLIYICNPGNPSGAVMSQSALQRLIELAQKHNVVIVSDECYSEIYRESAGAPCGLLQAAHAMGLDNYAGCLVFHSLSKRSNLPGMRSGFVAGDAALIEKFLLYRTYHGCSMAPPVQQASIAAWCDEEHVRENRQAYDKKYHAVTQTLAPVLPVTTPPAGFYLWPEIPLDDQAFTRQLYQQHNVAVVPGSYLAREIDGSNPGHRRIRMALVAPLDDCVRAAERIVTCLQT